MSNLIKYILFLLSVFLLIFSLYFKNYHFLIFALILILILIFDKLYAYLFTIQEAVSARKVTSNVDACIFINNTLKYKKSFAKLIRAMKEKKPYRHYIYVENAQNLTNLKYKLNEIIIPRLDNIKGNVIVFFYGYGYENYAFIGKEKITFETLYNVVLKYKNENASALILSNIFNNKNDKITTPTTDKVEYTNFSHINVPGKEKNHLLHLISTKKLFSRTQTDLEFYKDLSENMPNVFHYVNGSEFIIPSLT